MAWSISRPQNVATMWNDALVAIAVLLLSLVPGSGERPLATARAPV